MPKACPYDWVGIFNGIGGALGRCGSYEPVGHSVFLDEGLDVQLGGYFAGLWRDGIKHKKELHHEVPFYWFPIGTISKVKKIVLGL